MDSESVIRHLLCDDDSLSSYFGGKLVSVDTIKRRMFLLERSSNRHIADHYYRLNQEKSFADIISLTDLLTKGLINLAEKHLEFRKYRIHVKQEKQNEWQELITQIPPLVLQAAFIHKHWPFVGFKTDEIQKYFVDIILPNAKYTALPYPYISQLENYIESKQ